ncbi:MAG TPA: flagellar hook-basal body complex protein [Gemmatimonadaceae bacterium]|nr:flagellar hook-basal body complex protein [Gemmatimonadaceae bacterium]
MPSPSGLASAVNALRYYERRQEVVANNLANVSSDGFKAERVFAQLMRDANGAVAPVAIASTDLRAGALRETGAPLDLAIEGEGFLVVGTANGERLSRGGSLRIDAANRLVDAGGNPLLGAKGPVTFSPAQLAAAKDASIAIARDGTIRLGEQAIDVLRMERVAAGAPLQHEGAALFVPPAERAALAPDARTVRQGFVEGSNADSLGSLVDMIAVQRAFQSVQKTISVLDDVREIAANQLGKPV